MSDFDRLTPAHLRDAAEALADWVARERHDAQVAAEVLDEDDLVACRDRADRVEVVRGVLLAEAARREATSPQG